VIVVEPLRSDQEERYESFVRSRPDALFYHSLVYRDLLVELLGCEQLYVAAWEGDVLSGVLPLLAAQGTSGRILNSLPYYGSNGDVLAVSAEAEAALVAAYSRLAEAPETLAATVVPNPFRTHATDGYPSDVNERRLAHVTPLESVEDLWGRVEPSARRNVRRARRIGIEATRDDEALPRLHQLHDENIRALGGLPKERRFFELVQRKLRAGDHYRVWVALQQGEVVAALLNFELGRTIEYFTPAISHRHRADQPLALVLAAALEDAIERGLTRWNWGGTWLSQESLRRFKLKWGAEEQSYTYSVKLNDRSLLRRRPDAIMAEFPGFYVVPYTALEE
jgi:hypothetical protein